MNDTSKHDNDDVAAIVLEQAARLFQGEVTPHLLADADGGAWQQALWQQVAGAGLQLALVPEESGGAGLPLSVGLAVVRDAARQALPLPLGETMLAHALWTGAGGELGDTADKLPATLAPEAEGHGCTLRRDGSGWRLNGALHGVPWPAQAACVLLQARDESGQAMLVRLPGAGLPWTVESNLAHEPRGDLVLDGHAVAVSDLRLAPPGLREYGLQPHGALLRAWQLAGAMQRCYDLALDYARERVQFGKAIAAYAPVQTMLVEMAGHIAAAGAACEGAARAAAQAAGDDFLRAVAVAKSRTGEAAGVVSAHAHQVHGAIGFTQDHGLHHSTRRLWSWRDEFGSEAYWNRRLGEAVCAQGGAALWPALVRSA